MYYLDYQEELEQYNHEFKRHKELSKKDQCGIDEPKKPVQRRLICNDTTIEALRDILADGCGARKITCMWDELGAMLGNFDAYRSNSKTISRDRALYLELYNGGPKPIDRAGSVNIYVPNWSACISGTITSDVLLQFFGKLTGDGLLQRFLLYRARREGKGVDRTPDKEAEKRFYNTVKRLARLKPKGPTIIKLSDGAQAVRDRFEDLTELAYHLPGSSPAFKAHLNKFAGMFARLALTFYLADAISRDGDIKGPVPENISEMAAAVLIDYHIPVAREFYGKLGYGLGAGQDVIAIAGFILAKGANEIASRDISMSIRDLRGKNDEIQRAMTSLELYEWVRPTKRLKNARRITTWAINPKVHQRFERQARAETERRADAVRKIQEAVKAFSKNREEK